MSFSLMSTDGDKQPQTENSCFCLFFVPEVSLKSLLYSWGDCEGQIRRIRGYIDAAEDILTFSPLCESKDAGSYNPIPTFFYGYYYVLQSNRRHHNNYWSSCVVLL